ncbi:hypothetical protein E2C01_073871 [Portunus trituberculatus]|uniref:Secreted protein n=1 Tax=Portunus trituberculatus TaxID=210409 RepID=A0A5B7ICT9_PORTR|nr:hypothetical protein [Portunus trituberculatus]
MVAVAAAAAATRLFLLLLLLPRPPTTHDTRWQRLPDSFLAPPHAGQHPRPAPHPRLALGIAGRAVLVCLCPAPTPVTGRNPVTRAGDGRGSFNILAYITPLTPFTPLAASQRGAPKADR